MSHVGQVGQSYRILPVPPTYSILCVRPIPLVPCSPMESYLSHQYTQSYVSILSHLSHVGQVGQSYGMLPVPLTPPVLCVRTIPLVPCRTSRIVLWNFTHPMNILNPMCLSYPTCPSQCPQHLEVEKLFCRNLSSAITATQMDIKVTVWSLFVLPIL